jgi:hypothetical protein
VRAARIACCARLLRPSGARAHVRGVAGSLKHSEDFDLVAYFADGAFVALDHKCGRNCGAALALARSLTRLVCTADAGLLWFCHPSPC